MKAFGYQTDGAAADAFTEIELPTPKPASDEVVIEVAAFGLNHVDAFRRSGFSGGRATIPGFDVAGTVSAAGKRVTNFQVGDEVVAHIEGGGYAEQAVAPESTTIKLTEGFPITDAAGLPTVAMTSYDALTVFGQVQMGQTVAVLGASGGIGAMAVQFAKALGASTVIGIARAEDLDYVRQIGANDVATYAQVTEDGAFADSADVVINVNFMGGHADAMMALVKLGGTVATVGREESAGNKPNVEQVHIHPVDASHVHQAMQALKQLMDAGSLSVRIAKRFPFTLAGVVAASELNETGHTDGRIIVERDVK